MRRVASSLRVQLLLLVFSIVIPATAAICYNAVAQRNIMMAEAERNVLMNARHIAIRKSDFIARTEQLLKSLAAFPQVLSGGGGACSATLALLLERLEGYTTFMVADAGGEITCSGVPLTQAVSVSHRDYFERLRESREFVFSDYLVGQVTSRALAAAAYPVLADDGELQGAIIAGVDLERLHKQLTDLDLPEASVVTLIDRGGTVLARHPDPQDWVGESLPDDSFYRYVHQAKEGVAEHAWQDGVTRLYGYTTLGGAAHGVTAALGVSPSVAFAQADRVLLGNLVLLGAVALVAAGAAWFGVHRIVVRKVDTLVAAADRVAAGELGARTGLRKEGHELSRLAYAFDHMAESLQQREQELARSNAELEQFAYVASHDLQEPLRMVSSYVQLIAADYEDKLDDDGRESIAFAVDGAKRMRLLLNDLLQYSRVGRERQAFTSIQSSEIVKAALDNLRPLIDETSASIKHEELPVVMGDFSQLLQLFQNLIANAIKFRGDAAPSVEISAHDAGAMWRISVRDNGIGIDEPYFERIFAIFQRLHTRGEFAGTGIGLALCRKIVDRHGGSIWVNSQLGHGATFSFTLPKGGLEGGTPHAGGS